MDDSMQESQQDPSPIARSSNRAEPRVVRSGRRSANDGGGNVTQLGRVALRPADSSKRIDEQRLARALGWFSVALGVAEVMAPRRVGKAIGFDRHPGLMQAVGLREIASGIGILTLQRQPDWLWSRVAGDAVDLALLGAAMNSKRSNRGRLVAATVAVAGVAALDIYCSRQLSRNDANGRDNGSQQSMREMVTVAASPEACYGLWRNVENFPRFMRHVESVQETGDGQAHWRVKVPGGTTIEWDSKITADETNRMLAWESLPDAAVDHHGCVRFEPAPGGRGTIVNVLMSYASAVGSIGVLAANPTGAEPQQQVHDDLRRFKQLIETGEIPTTEGQPAGRSGTRLRLLGKGRVE
ncbi:MAG: SRPBCC family protein [Betaproteobacteria bacterium]